MGEESDDDIDDEINNQSEDDVADKNDNEDDLDEDNDADDELQDLSDIDFTNVDDEDLTDMEFNDGSVNEDDELVSSLKRKVQDQQQGPRNKNKEKKRGKGIDNNIFVSAEKFSEMLEEQSRTKGKHGGSNIFNSSDGASAKQIDWEIKRNQRFKKEPYGRKKRKHNPKRMSSNSKQIKRFKQ